MKPNPYRSTVQAAAPRDDEIVVRPQGLLTAAVIETLVALAAAWALPILIDEFEALYKGFGAQLPRSTQFMLGARHGWWVFFFVALATLIWIGTRESQPRRELRHKKLLLALNAVVFGFAVTFMIVALYQPIFKLGAAV
jgi:type II secretory pathway component PulF